MAEFKTSDAYQPTGDQPQAIETLSEALSAGERYQTLLGATGTGKTATMAWIIEEVGRPALLIAHNKTLAAQLCNELREFFPNNAVEYFVSYYDYYQPEAYVPQADLYIEKDSSQNDDIARLRLAATSSLFTRRDVVVVASVSCIYGLGSPEEWRDRVLILTVGEEHDRDLALRKLIDSQYVRNDSVLGRGRFRVKGDVVEVQPANSGDRVQDLLLRRRGRADQPLRPADGRDLHAARQRRDLARDRVRDLEADDRARRRRDPPRARAAGRAVRVREPAAGGAPDPPAHRVRPRDAEGARLLQRDRELLADPRRSTRPGRTRSRCSTTSRRTSSSSSTSRTRPCRSSAACTRATARASRRSSTTASGCRRRSTTGRSASTSSSRRCRRWSSSPRRRGRTSSATRPGSPSS